MSFEVLLRRHQRGLHRQAQLFADLQLQLLGEVGIVAQELLGVFASLAEAEGTLQAPATRGGRASWPRRL